MIGIKNIADDRLGFALKCVQEVIDLAETFLSEEERKQTPIARKGLGRNNDDIEVAKNYHQYIKSFGMLMLNGGLVAALLFAQGKANKGNDNKAKAYGFIIKHLTEWLQLQNCVSQAGKADIEELYGKDGADIRQATREALAFLQDLKRVADARLQKPEKQ